MSKVVEYYLRQRCLRRTAACSRSCADPDGAMPLRGVSFARYLRKVHVEWCPFKPKAVGPVFFSEIHTNTIKDAAPKLTVSKALLPKPREPADGSAPAFLDRAHVTFADGSERTIDFSEVPTIRDILEELDSENVRIAQEERKRGKPFS